MPELIIEVEGGVVIAVYTDLDVTVAVNDHDEGIEEGSVVLIPLSPTDTPGDQPGHARTARAEGVIARLQEAVFICEGYEAELAESRDCQAGEVVGKCFRPTGGCGINKPRRRAHHPPKQKTLPTETLLVNSLQVKFAWQPTLRPKHTRT